MYQDIIKTLIFGLGLITVCLSIIVSFKFNRYKRGLSGHAKRLSNAISWQLIGEATIGIGTLVFSGAAYYGVLDSWSIGFQSGIRFVMFFATATTTFHLLRTLKSMS